MIYAIAEWTATITENIIFFIYLIVTLSYKSNSKSKTAVGTAIFFIIQCCTTLIIDRYYTFEGILVMLNILILFAFCRTFLKHSIWYQLIVLLIAFASLFTINIGVTILTGLIMQNTSTDVLSMQNSIRIFLLFITKAMLCLVLILFSFLFRRKKLIISTIQCIAMSCVFLITFLIGVTLERIQTENNVAGWEISAIIGCLIVINCILFFVLCQFSYQNKMKVNHALLKMQIQNEQQKLQDAIRWNAEIETVRHDLQNHLLCISEYIREDKPENALQYIQKISDKAQKEIPRRTATKYPALNAILDLKRKICTENNIDFKCFILEEMPDIDDTDFCIVLANLLDNAIEAEMKEKVGEIRLAISTTGNYLRITVQNKISESVLEHNKNLNSSKDNSKLHGFGIQSVKETVQKNDGMQEFYEENGWFIADVMLKIRRIK